MTTTPQAPEPSPILFFQTATAYQRTYALKAALEVGLFSALGEGADTAKALAQRCQASERGMRILCDFLTIIGFRTKHGNEYSATVDTAGFLDQRSPTYMGGTLEFLLSSPMKNAFEDLTNAVRKGGTTLPEEGTVAREHPEWVTFARAMAPMMAGPAQWMAQLVRSWPKQPTRVLDVAAGHGLFGIEVAKVSPKTEVVALDWANVLTVAEEGAKAAGLGNRYRTVPGSAFEAEFGKGYDLVLLTNFLHHFDPATCEALLRKVHAALAEDGRVITLEFVPNEDRVSPESADFSLIMLATTPLGDAYTFAELERMFNNSGFGRSELHPVPRSKQHVLVTYKKSG